MLNVKKRTPHGERVPVYVAVPLDGVSPERSEMNARLARARITESGCEPTTRRDIYCGKDATPEDIIAANVRRVLDCRQVWLLPGWGKDRLCNVVKAVAVAEGIDVVRW